MHVVDTNILVYAADTDSPFHGRCRKALEQWRTQNSVWYTTWSIIYEFVRVTTHPRVMRTPLSVADSWRFIDAVLASPSLSILVETDRHSDVVAQVFDELPHLQGNIIHDAHTAILMREHGLRRIFTRDTDFHRFPFLEVTDPVSG
jgi:toxin-antitoxin system PIN domain toxin